MPHYYRLLTLLLAAAATRHASCSELVRFERSEPHMGTRFTITLFASDRDSAEAAFQSAFQRIAELDQAMSDYRPDSEISRLNAGGQDAGKTTPVSDDVWRVLVRGQQIAGLTNGAFDMTLGPLTRLWRRARRTRQLPDAERLAEARAAVGFQRLRLHRDQQGVQLGPGMRLDLGGIAKGDALDQVMAAIQPSGISRVLIDGGGDLLAGDPPPGLRGWRIGLVGLDKNAEVSESIWLSNRAIATSGDLWQYVEIDGQRYSHLIDPKTGRGLTTRSTVSVVAPRAIDADALASAVSVMGPEKGLRLLAAQPDVEGRVVHSQGDRIVVVMTPGFERIRRAEPAVDALAPK